MIYNLSVGIIMNLLRLGIFNNEIREEPLSFRKLANDTYANFNNRSMKEKFALIGCICCMGILIYTIENEIYLGVSLASLVIIMESYFIPHDLVTPTVNTPMSTNNTCCA